MRYTIRCECGNRHTWEIIPMPVMINEHPPACPDCGWPEGSDAHYASCVDEPQANTADLHMRDKHGDPVEHWSEEEWDAIIAEAYPDGRDDKTIDARLDELTKDGHWEKEVRLPASVTAERAVNRLIDWRSPVEGSRLPDGESAGVASRRIPPQPQEGPDVPSIREPEAQHVTDGSPCWCNPTVENIDHDTYLFIHNDVPPPVDKPEVHFCYECKAAIDFSVAPMPVWAMGLWWHRSCWE